MKLLIYDSTQRKGPLDETWKLGAWAGRTFGVFDAVHGFSSWLEALRWAADLSEASDKHIDELHLWGHGYPGGMLLGYYPLGLDEVVLPGQMRMLLDDLRQCLHGDSLVWLRSCACFGGPNGKTLARELAAALGCRVAGHTYNIGLWHSGLHSLQPGHDPSWSDDEGRGKDNRPKWSHPFAPNTITFARGSIPARW